MAPRVYSAQGKLIDEKNLMSKISCPAPFKRIDQKSIGHGT
jgi:hypothetical protein